MNGHEEEKDSKSMTYSVAAVTAEFTYYDTPNNTNISENNHIKIYPPAILNYILITKLQSV